MKKLNMPMIQQKRNGYCVPNSIKAIIKYFDSLKRISQDKIFKDLGGNIDTPEMGLYVDNSTAEYLRKQTNKDYQLIQLIEGFGKTKEEKELFQSYISDSIDKNIPVLISYSFEDWIDDTQDGHALVIQGIKVDYEDSGKTIYFCVDSGEEHTFIGNDLIVYSLLDGIDLIGIGALDFESKVMNLMSC